MKKIVEMYKCPNCSGKLEETDNPAIMRCMFCGTEFGVEEVETQEEEVEEKKEEPAAPEEEDKDRIFLPNFTTKSGGSGVGLSLTYNIVQAAGGTISFESQEGEGAEFIIELPKQDGFLERI